MDYLAGMFLLALLLVPHMGQDDGPAERGRRAVPPRPVVEAEPFALEVLQLPLARMGRGPFFASGAEASHTLEEVVRSAVSLASRMLGGLIVLERHMGLADYAERGTLVDARVSRELLVSIFQPPGPLHDGAVIISGDRIKAARCLLPLSTNPNLGRHLGTRHRAALGLSEESDAVCVVVSEERGRVSVAVDGRLTPDLDAAALRTLLFELFEVEPSRRRRWWRLGRSARA